MFLLRPLVGFGLRQLLGDGIENVVVAVEQRFRDHGQALPRALERAHDRAWQSLGVALAGDGLFDRARRLFASGEEKGLRDQVQTFLEANGDIFGRTPADMREACLGELGRLRKSGLISGRELVAAEIALQAEGFRCYVDPQGLVEGARQAVAFVAEALREGYPNLSRLLCTPTPAGPPLLAAAFTYFLRREIETNVELANGLFFDGLRQLTISQARAFEELGKALALLGDHFDELFDQMGIIQQGIDKTHATAVETLDAVKQLGRHLEDSTQNLHQFEQVKALLSQLLERTHGLGHRSPSTQQHPEIKSLLARFCELVVIRLASGVEMTFSRIYPGNFLRGSSEKERGRKRNEGPQHVVTLTRDFCLGIYPVTQAQWWVIMGSQPSHFKGDERPVEGVSWFDSQEFCCRLGEKIGKAFRLPTEAEWEYACRAGTRTAYHGGDEVETLKRIGWCSYDGNLGSAKETQPVGQFLPNARGLFDMHGNIWEWCADWYDENYYTKESVTDPSGPRSGQCRVVRGGCWKSVPKDCRSASRRGDSPDARQDRGCRVVLVSP
jgi:formylglycine-generating enzyme required for sulfatase activity